MSVGEIKQLKKAEEVRTYKYGFLGKIRLWMVRNRRFDPVKQLWNFPVHAGMSVLLIIVWGPGLAVGMAFGLEIGQLYMKFENPEYKFDRDQRIDLVADLISWILPIMVWLYFA